MTSQHEKKIAAQEAIKLRNDFAKRARQAQREARDLEEQALRKRQVVDDMARQAIIMHEAYELMQREIKDNSVTASFEGLTKQELAKLGKRQFVFIIDGSGSMTGEAIIGALKSAYAFAEKISAAGGKVDCMLFGNAQPIRFDILDPESYVAAGKGLNSGTDLAPTLASLPDVLDKRKTAHAVIFSDGDLFDHEASVKAFNTLMTEYSKLTFDALEFSSQMRISYSREIRKYDLLDGVPYFKDAFADAAVRGSATNLEKFVTVVAQQQTDGRDVNFVQANGENAVEALGNLIAKRLQEAAPKPAAKPTASKKSPGA